MEIICVAIFEITIFETLNNMVLLFTLFFPSSTALHWFFEFTNQSKTVLLDF